METIFIVDDAGSNLAMAKQALEGQYRVITMTSAAKMFNFLEKMMPDLILLDIEMQEMDGFAALEKLQQGERTAKIPVIFLTAQSDAVNEARGFEIGAVDFIRKPFSEPVLLNRVACHLHIADLIANRTRRVERLQNSIVSVLADLVEVRDSITGGHIERIAYYVKMILEEMVIKGLYANEMHLWNLSTVASSARLHDVGKIIVSDLILNKPGKLTAEEFEIVKTHATAGEKIIDNIIKQTGEDIFLEHAKLFAGYHNEKWDGSGYPYGLKGEAIPLQGRIMAIADVYDALLSVRPYKEAFAQEESMKYIKDNAGKHFDPKLTELFVSISNRDEFKKINVCKP